MRFTVLFLWIISPMLLARAEDWQTTDGKTYKDIKVVKQDAVYVTILCADGGAKIEISNLPPDLQKKLNYDPLAAQAQVATTKKEQDEITANKAATKILYDNELTATGSILQVVPGGIIVNIVTQSHKMHTVTTTEQVTQNIETGVGNFSRGTSDVQETQTIYKDHSYPETTSLAKAFIKCDTTGLVDDQHWEGHIWKIGTYSYETVAGSSATIGKFTNDIKEAYDSLIPSLVNQSPSTSSN